MAPFGPGHATQVLREEGDNAHAARLSALGALSASIAHEISQRLGAILANVDAAELMLERGQPDVDAVRRILHDVRADTRGAADVMTRMRALFRRRRPASAPLDVNRAVAAALRVVAHQADRRRVVIITELCAGLPRVAGDSVQMEQIVINLVLNAMDAVHGRATREVRVQTRHADAGVELRVADSGAGIPAACAGQLFDPFFTTKPDGTGLGLWIVRGIVEAHRGRVWAEPQCRSGAAFRVWLPALAGAAT
jgi:C4-dicarboxylate-specific signal transduction histidine kinase